MRRQRDSVVVSKYRTLLRGFALPLVVIGKNQTSRHTHSRAHDRRHACENIQKYREKETCRQEKISTIFSFENFKWIIFPAPAKISVEVSGSGKLLFSKIFGLLALLLHAIKSLVNSSTKRPGHLVAEPFYAAALNMRHPSRIARPFAT
jgi:hypothetical protein